MAENRLEELKQTLENRLMEMANLISRREYNLGLVKGRQALEQVVREYAKSGRVMYTDLADTIESLYQAGQIARETRDAFHNIRLLGNKAVHEGDNSPEDAERSYYLLRKQIEVFLNRELQRADRTPVGVAREDAASQVSRQFAESSQYQPETRGRRQPQYAGGAQQTRRSAQSVQDSEEDEKSGRRTRSGSGRGAEPARGRGERQRSTQAAGGRTQRNRQNRVPTREDRLRAQRQGGSMRGRRSQGGVQPQDLLRILIPVICIILLIILIRSCARPSGTDQTQTTPVSSAAQTESTTEAVETEPETTEAEVIRYKVKGSAVNARYADNQNRVYEQLSAGTEIGEITPIEGSDFVKFQRDGIDLVINKNYIEPIEDTADADSVDAETTAAEEGTPEEGEQ